METSEKSNGTNGESKAQKRYDDGTEEESSLTKRQKSVIVLDVSSGDEGSSFPVAEDFNLNASYIEQLESFKKFYDNEQGVPLPEFIKNNVEIFRKPFQVVKMIDFIQNEKVYDSVMNLVSKLALHEKHNDLFSLKQSKDLANYSIMKNLVDFFKTKVKSYMEKLTGFKLNDHVALTISRYDKNDYLLCHDDQLDQRKIAFIWYLVDDEWSADDGGLLELFSVAEDDGQPVEVTERMIPKRNSFAFFPVQPISFHQVSEVLTSRSPRWSINGWFHSDDAKVVDLNFKYPRLPTFPDNEILDEDLSSHFYQWINPIYLDESIQKKIKTSFYLNCDARLGNFLLLRKRKELEEALKSETVSNCFRKFYKPLFIHCEYIDFEDFERLPDVLKEFILLIHSDHFLKLLNKLTGVTFEPKKNSKKLSLLENKQKTDEDDEEDDDDDDDDDVQLLESKTEPSTSSEEPKNSNRNHRTRGSVVRWNHGFYSLSNDISPEIDEMALDVDFFFNVPDNTQVLDEKEPEVIDLCDDSDDDDDDEEENPEPSKKPEPELIELDDENSDSDSEDDENTSQDSGSCSEKGSKVENSTTSDHGGYIAYIADDFTGQVLEVEPDNGSLNIVFRRYKCQRFMKYIDKSNDNVPFHHISVVFSKDS